MWYQNGELGQLTRMFRIHSIPTLPLTVTFVAIMQICELISGSIYFMEENVCSC